MNKDSSHSSIVQDIAEYYGSKVTAYGETPRGVDWNSDEGQNIRFRQLTKVITTETNYSVADLGCGYGALYDYLKASGKTFEYCGYDISEEMIRRAVNRFYGSKGATFILSDKINEMKNFSIASGIFNVRQHYSDDEWLSYILNVLDNMNQYSEFGFSFNCLTSYSDELKMKSYLYYADPLVLFDICKRRYSNDVALLHDYGLYEFTIIVRKSYE